jgi:hypothetical protein
MMENATLSLLTGTALTDGIAFLYAQASELLSRRRDRKKERPAPEGVSQGALDGKLDTTRVNDDALDQLAAPIGENRGALLPYWEGDIVADPRDERLLNAMERLRGCLEAVYGQAITFAGESGRDATGTQVSVRAVLGDVYGKAEIGRVGTVEDARIDLVLHAGTIGAGGSVSFAKIDRVGRSHPDTAEQE